MKDAELKTLSIVMPVFNERQTILRAIWYLIEAPLGGIQKEIILVDDGSTDGTREILLAFKKQLNSRRLLQLQNPNFALALTAPAAGTKPSVFFRFIFHARNQGKGAAVKSGFYAARGEAVLIQDSDLEYDPRDIPFLLEPMLHRKAEVVYGSRFITTRPRRILYNHHYIANRVLTMFSNLLTNLNISDMETGYKLFKKEVAQKILPHLRSKRFGFEPEITALIAKLGCSVYEVGISYTGRLYQEGKKIRWTDGLAALWHIVRHNLLRLNPFSKI